MSIIDDVALRQVFKSVDAVTLQMCRQVSWKWNYEILRLNKYTRKFTPSTLIIELSSTVLTLSSATSKHRNSFRDSFTDSKVIQNILLHVAPPKSLNFLLQSDADPMAFERMMEGLNASWSHQIHELEISSQRNGLKLSNIIGYLQKFPSISCLSLTHFCDDSISCADVFKSLPELKYLRICCRNENDDSGSSSGLVFDDASVKQLLKNQNEKYRKIQMLELFDMDVNVSTEVMTDALRDLARLQQPLQQMDSKDLEDKSTVHLLFHNCRWNLMKELNLITSIINIASDFTFPIRQSESESILSGDFKFTIAETNFVLKFEV